MPSIVRIILKQTADPNSTISESVLEEVDELVEEGYRTELY